MFLQSTVVCNNENGPNHSQEHMDPTPHKKVCLLAESGKRGRHSLGFALGTETTDPKSYSNLEAFTLWIAKQQRGVYNLFFLTWPLDFTPAECYYQQFRDNSGARLRKTDCKEVPGGEWWKKA